MLDELVRRYQLEHPLHVTRPSLPDLARYSATLERVWKSGWLTNDGELHCELEAGLRKRLEVEHLSLCCNGTIALLLALQAARINGGEVITTPFTFPATPHALHWNRVRPVFCDIEEETFGLDPERIEGLIGPDTRAILPVHLFGTPCQVDAIQTIADHYGLPVIYDAAHMVGVRYRGQSILRHGDFSILSFHATKPFTTGEGGAIISKRETDQVRIDFLRNFGIADEETVIGPGINGKMSELQAALGLLQLETLDGEIARRKSLTELYRESLRDIPGISVREDREDVEHNYSHLPILIDADRYGRTRDELCSVLKQFNVFARKYFHPPANRYACYASLPSSRPELLPVAESVSSRILCLPLFGGLEPDTVRRVCTILTELGA